jgi:hypothetical protein
MIQFLNGIRILLFDLFAKMATYKNLVKLRVFEKLAGFENDVKLSDQM